MGIASLILGIVTIVISFIPFIKMVGIVTGILALIFGIVDLIVNKESGKKLSKGLVGIILALCSVWIMIISTIFGFVMLFSFIDENFDDFDCYEDYNYYDIDEFKYDNYFDENYNNWDYEDFDYMF